MSFSKDKTEFGPYVVTVPSKERVWDLRFGQYRLAYEYIYGHRYLHLNKDTLYVFIYTYIHSLWVLRLWCLSYENERSGSYWKIGPIRVRLQVDRKRADS